MGMCTEVLPVHYVMYREVGVNSGHFVQTYKSPVVSNTRDPVWEPKKMRLAKFSNGDPTIAVKIVLMCDL